MTIKYLKIKEYVKNRCMLYEKAIDILERYCNTLRVEGHTEAYISTFSEMLDSMKRCLVVAKDPKILEQRLNANPPGQRPGLGFAKELSEMDVKNDELLNSLYAVSQYYNVMGYREYEAYAEKELKKNLTKEERKKLLLNLKHLEHKKKFYKIIYEREPDSINVLEL